MNSNKRDMQKKFPEREVDGEPESIEVMVVLHDEHFKGYYDYDEHKWYVDYGGITVGHRRIEDSEDIEDWYAIPLPTPAPVAEKEIPIVGTFEYDFEKQKETYTPNPNYPAPPPLPKEAEGKETIKDYLERRIKELYAADAAFCEYRWNMSLPDFQRAIAREGSNQVTFARQELQEVLKHL